MNGRTAFLDGRANAKHASSKKGLSAGRSINTLSDWNGRRTRRSFVREGTYLGRDEEEGDDDILR